VDAFRQDVRYALRGLVRSPGFTALTVLCLALGVGINSTVFTIADNVSLKPLPFAEPERLVVLYSIRPGGTDDRARVSYQDYRDWKEQTRAFDDIGAYTYRSLSITEGVESERFLGSAISWNLFSLLGEQPVLGRPLSEEDDKPGAPPVVILSHGLWQRRFASDPSIVGRTIIVDGTAHTVVAVMRPRFQFPQISQLWIPVVPVEHAGLRRDRTLRPVARLAAGKTIAAANDDLTAVAGRLASAHRDDDGWSAKVAPLRDELMPTQLQLATTAMLGAVSLVLIIACANVANLLLARATGRRREMAVRISLGAGRGRLIRQLLTESVLLALISAPLGLLIAYAGLESILAAIPPTVVVPYYVDWSMNTRVVIYTTAVTMVTGLLFGLAPVLQAGRLSPAGALKEGSRGSGLGRGGNRLRNALVIAEVALSLMLLVGASLFVRSILNIYNADAGIDTTKLMTLRVFMPGDGYASPAAITARVEDLMRRIEALPGVTSAFASNLVPFSGGGGTSGIVGEGMTVEAGKEPRASFFSTTAHALATLDQTLIAGRDFTDAEASTRSSTALVNRALAARAWPGQSDIVGRRFRLANAPADEWHTVIGVVSDFQPLVLRDKGIVEPLAILPFPYQAMRDTGVTIRVAGMSSASITAPARRAIGESDASLTLFDVRTGDENREGRLWAPLFISWMFSIFGVAALFLASIGIYGVLSYSVSQRTQEFGVRMALGASRGSVLGLVLGQGARLAAAGIAIGALGAVVVTRAVQSLLYNVTATDPISFAGTTAVLVVVTLIAGCIPAGRATSVDPTVALRSD
jgi:putative ABC transport system permease protein